MTYGRDIPTYPIDLPSETVDLVIAERWTPDYSTPEWWKRSNIHETPSPGDPWSYGDMEPATRQTASHVVIRYASYSDYSGSDVEASNYPYAEAVGSVVFPNSDALAEHVVTAILDGWATAIGPADRRSDSASD